MIYSSCVPKILSIEERKVPENQIPPAARTPAETTRSHATAAKGKLGY